jgi:hypothetical protein
MRWLCRFGLRLGLDLMVAVIVLCVLFMALEPRAEAGVGASDGEGVAFGSDVDIAVAAGHKNKIRIVHPNKRRAHIRQDPYQAQSRSKRQKSVRLC